MMATEYIELVQMAYYHKSISLFTELLTQYSHKCENGDFMTIQFDLRMWMEQLDGLCRPLNAKS